MRQADGRDCNPTAESHDSQSTKTTKADGDLGYNGEKKMRGRKRHIAVDTQSNRHAVVIHAVNISDRDGA